MAFVPDFNNLPKCLTDAWRIDRDVYLDTFDGFERYEELESWSIPSLMTLFLRMSKDRSSTNADDLSHSNSSDNNNTNDNDPIDIPQVSDNPHRMRSVFRSAFMDKELPYVQLHHLIEICDLVDDSIDVDGAILNGEIHI